ncbi:hypothetical protein BU23DRAFT_444274 [Bimuria novae-zelandiae CBS 107.79]|uniref:Uncharacterized protein n=1 Tax=Bimuria novae-zelandiae CBS 107.79 TaxID=1447943 RepID=A0A6A5VU70_9PLEO|nr:hypothetical protein BU23DRAFT_444274 [Bimuria novae-zelandiae CBS 107.79]
MISNPVLTSQGFSCRRAVVPVTDNCINDKLVLQIAIKALNNTVGPNGLVPTLLVFRTYLRINIDSALSPNIIT